MKLKKIRNALLVVLTLALVSATAVTITWALTNKATNQLVNTFTEDEIDAKLEEPWWDFKDWDFTNKQEKDVNKTDMTNSPYNYPMVSMGLNQSEDDPIKGEDYAKKYSAGQFIPKNPFIYNTNDVDASDANAGSEYVAMTVDYVLRVPATDAFGETETAGQYNLLSTIKTNEELAPYLDENDYVFSIPYATFQQIADVNCNYAGDASTASVPQFNLDANTISTSTSKWEKTGDDNKVFYYDTRVAPHAKTEPLFQYVRINPNITTNIGITEQTAADTDATKLIYKVTVPFANGTNGTLDIYLPELPAFDIKLKGFAVDADNMEGADDDAKLTNAKAALNGLIAANS